MELYISKKNGQKIEIVKSIAEDLFLIQVSEDGKQTSIELEKEEIFTIIKFLVNSYE